MYWYLSFLRPPPVALALPSEGVVVTPQVANDLRTEQRLSPTEIWYTWQRVLPFPSDATPAAHLTHFEPPSSTYRPLTVPLPRAARAGESWRLGLFAPPATGPATALAELMGDPGVLGVWSEGIALRRGEGSGQGAVRGMGERDRRRAGGKGDKADKGEKGGKGKDTSKGKDKKDDGPKQSRITRDFPIPEGLGNAGMLRVVEQTSFDLDKKVWDSGLALAAWLFAHRSVTTRPPGGMELSYRQEALWGWAIARACSAETVIELGSGTGLVGIAMAMALRDVPSATGTRRIMATDLDSAMEIMRENVVLNGVEDAVTPAVLDWEAPLPDFAEQDLSKPPHVIIAADVTYNTSSFPALVRTLSALLKRTPKEASIKRPAHDPFLLLAYKQRDPAERDLWDMLAEHRIEMVLIDRVQGAEDEGETEIWVGGKNLLN